MVDTRSATRLQKFGMPSHRIVVLGDRRSGKTSLIGSLKSGICELNYTPTDGVEVTEWQPAVDSYTASGILKKLGVQNPESIKIELWDMTGRRCCWPIHQSYFTPTSTYLIMFNWLKEESVESAFYFIRLVQQKVPGSLIILTVTRSGDTRSERVLEKVKRELQEKIKQLETETSNILIDEMNSIRECTESPLALKEVAKYEDLLIRTLNVHREILEVDLQSRLGLETCMASILQTILLQSDEDKLNNFLPEDPPMDHRILALQLSELKSRDQIIVSPSEITIERVDSSGKGAPVDTTSTEQSNHDNTMNQLVSKGLIMKMQSPKPPETERICIDPMQLANASCLFHFDDLNKRIQLEAYRFWPKDSGHARPDPGLLVKALEEIPTSGVIREVLFPLLWQEKKYSEDQIKLMLSVLRERNLLSPPVHNPTESDQPMEDLHLPNYPSLSTHTQHFLPLLGTLNTCKPGVNWSDELFVGDVHFGFIFSFPNKDDTRWLFKQIQQQYNNHPSKQTYKYLWDNGLLCKYKEEVTAHVYYTEDGELYACCRGPYDVDTDLIRKMWLALKPPLHIIHGCLTDYPGIVYHVDIEAKGSPLVMKMDAVASRKTSSIRHSIWSCLHSYLLDEHALTNNGTQLDLDMVFSPIKENIASGKHDSWVDAICPGLTIQDVIEIEQPVLYQIDNSKAKPKSSRRAPRVNWRSNISEEIDMAKKEYEESHKPHTISDKCVRKQLRRIAHSLVTSVIASAVATVMVNQGQIHTKQEPLVELVANAAKAGYKGDTQLIVDSMNRILQISAQLTAESQASQKTAKSKVCVIL